MRSLLSSAQERLWFIDQLEGTSAEYNIQQALRLRGRLDRRALEWAINRIVERHESLRSHFEVENGHPVQIADPGLQIAVQEENLSGLDQEEKQERVKRTMRHEREQPFDLARGPMLRMKLLKLGDLEHVLLRTMHHIISDGWSQRIFNREFVLLYEAYQDGRTNPLEPLTAQYSDFVRSQSKWLEGGALVEGLAYWKQQLAGIPDALQLPTDRPRPSRQTFGAEAHYLTLSSDRVAALKRVARDSQATLYMTLLAAFAILLGRYSAHDDIVVGSPVANRHRTDFEKLIGLFVNTLAIRVRLNTRRSFRDVLEEVRRTALEAYRYQNIPFERIVEHLTLQRRLNITPIFQVLFALQNPPVVEQKLNDLEVESEQPEDVHVRFDLELRAGEVDKHLRLYWLYNRDLYDRWRIEQMAEHYVRLLDQIGNDPAIAVRELEILSVQQRRHILEEFNGTERQVEEATFPVKFEQQVERTPDAVAVVCGRESLTYRELNVRANQLAHYLDRLGAEPGKVVGIRLERSLQMVVAMIGVLKTGAAYLPLDPGYPAERIAHMVKDCRPAIIISQRSFQYDSDMFAPGNKENAGQGEVPVEIFFDDQSTFKEIAEQTEENLTTGSTWNVRHTALGAYIIYTSGSTGSPKGVLIDHRAMMNFIEAFGQKVKWRTGDRHIAVTTIGFDIAILELLLPLCYGASVEIASETDLRDPDVLFHLLQHATSIQTTPSRWAMLLQNGRLSLPPMRILVGGEPLSLELVRQLYKPGVEIWNLYGPTEATIWATGHKFREVDLRSVTWGCLSIGAPLANYRVYVLDRNLVPVPIGVSGELYISSVGLARGYLNQPALTAERFVADPYTEGGRRMYRTGDLARWRFDGNLEFLGRTDEQVKIRGARIELGEIENVLKSERRVHDAVVIVQGKGEEKRLIAYVVVRPNGSGAPMTKTEASGEGSIDCEKAASKLLDDAVLARELRQYLQGRLPAHMVPAAIVAIDAFPLTANGKLDRRGLPLPKLTSTTGYRSPQSPKEEILCGLFAEVLGVERVGLDDDFFALGGHSLMAARLVSRVRACIGVELAVRTLFELPTVGQLAPSLQNRAEPRPSLALQQRPKRLPLSYAQQRFWFLDRLQGSSTEYNICEALRLSGELDKEALRRTIETIVERHEILRTHFREADGEPLQVIESELSLEIQVEDLTGLDGVEQQGRILEALRQEREVPFNLARGPLLRLKLLKLGEQEHVLLRTIHHIVTDGWSEGIFNREVMALYEGYREGRGNPLEPLPIQYADFALWQKEWLESGAIEEGLAYWKRQLAGIPERLELPTDRARSAVQTFNANAYHISLSGELLTAINRLNRDHHVTLYMSLLAAFGILLWRYSGQDDIVVGSPIANRPEEQLEDMIGPFVNSLVVRLRLRREMNFSDLLGQVRRTSLEAYQHQDVPFERLVEELSPKRTLDSSLLFQIMFAVQNVPGAPRTMKGLKVEPIKTEELRVRHDLEVYVRELAGRLECSWLYNRDLFDRWRVEQMGRHYVRVLEAVLADPSQAIGRIDLLELEERRRILEEWNDTSHEVPEATLPEVFEIQVERNPDCVAAVYGNQQLTFAEMNQRANRLAHVLIAQGIGPEDRVALALPRSLETIVCLLGVLKSGAAYIPLDLEYPVGRLALMLNDAAPACILTTCEVARVLPGRQRLLVLDQPEIIQRLKQSSISNPMGADRMRPLTQQNSAYVIYTSGSTGSPKAVVGLQLGLVNRLNWFAKLYSFQREPMLAKSSLSFIDGSTELLGPLLHGGSVVLTDAASTSSLRLAALMAQHRIGYVTLVPSLLTLLLTEYSAQQCASSKIWISSGEMLPGSYALRFRQALPHTRLLNLYGASETTGDSVFAECDGADVPIGRPIWNTRVYVLDESLEPVPIGVSGELYIAGVGLARGYLNKSGLTGERFVADPYGMLGSRMYRTGDLARWRADGNIEYMGRNDHQVKVRGFRVELGEVEAALLQHSDVSQAAVIVTEDTLGEKRLVAYVVATAGHNIDSESLRTDLGRLLPHYMIPAVIVVLETIPLTPNGKLDRNALPVPQLTSRVGYRPPRTSEEEILCEIFAEVLGVEKVGLDDDFFELGGHSLLATRLVNRVWTVLAVELPIRTLFESPNVGELSKRLGKPKQKGVRLARRRQMAGN